MSNFDHKGPGGLGPKTGKKLGKCSKTENEKKEINEIYFLRKETINNLSSIKGLKINEKNSDSNYNK